MPLLVEHDAFNSAALLLAFSPSISSTTNLTSDILVIARSHSPVWAWPPSRMYTKFGQSHESSVCVVVSALNGVYSRGALASELCGRYDDNNIRMMIYVVIFYLPKFIYFARTPENFITCHLTTIYPWGDTDTKWRNMISLVRIK